MIQQDSYSQGRMTLVVDERMGLRLSAEGVLWGETSGFSQGE
jgi:hypothetical protein